MLKLYFWKISLFDAILILLSSLEGQPERKGRRGMGNEGGGWRGGEGERGDETGSNYKSDFTIYYNNNVYYSIFVPGKFL